MFDISFIISNFRKKIQCEFANNNKVSSILLFCIQRSLNAFSKMTVFRSQQYYLWCKEQIVKFCRPKQMF